MSPFISIIIPFYGTADPALLQRCLESIHRQGMEEGSYEVIVTDDDGKGLGAARNKGMCQATGTYLLFIDADDYLLSGIDICFSHLKEKHPDVCSFSMCKVKEKGAKPFRSAITWWTYDSGVKFLNNRNFTGNACRHFFCRSFLNDHDITFAEGCYHEDEDFLLKVYCRARTTVITDACLYGYYMNPSSITHRHSLEMRLCRLADFHKMLHRVKTLYLSIKAAEGEESERAAGVKRRLSFLTIDYIRLLLRNRSPYLWKELRTLKSERFLPLPKQGYTWEVPVGL